MFDPKLRIGQVLTEAELNHLFECQTQKGIRKGIKNNLIVLIHKTYDNEYPDIWDNDILIYTGTKASSDESGQTLTGPGNNNGYLRDTWYNRNNPDNPTLFLFKKPAENTCIYLGMAAIVAEPYREPSKPGSSFHVWRFPLKLISVDEDKIKADYDSLEKAASEKSIDELRKSVRKALHSGENVEGKEIREVTSVRYERNPLFSAFVKMRAEGVCDLCRKPAPFSDKNEKPYLESHHIHWLSKGGKDSPENMVALCPNCHKRIHVLQSDEDNQMLKQRASQYSAL